MACDIRTRRVSVDGGARPAQENDDMMIRIGTMFMGEVDGVAGQSVQTKFFVFGVPLVPLSSCFFTAAGRGIEIPLHGKSVLAGYLRMGFGLGALLLTLFAFLTPSYRRDASDFVGPALAIAGFVASLVFLGRLTAPEKQRRAILMARTGLAAEPEILPRDVRSEIEKRLRERLEAKSLPLRPDAWIAAAAPSGAGGAYRENNVAIEDVSWTDAYAYARYARVDDRAWAAALEPIWSKIGGSE